MSVAPYLPVSASVAFFKTPSIETGMGICVTMDQYVQQRASSVLCDFIIRNRGISGLLHVMLQYLLLGPVRVRGRGRVRVRVGLGFGVGPGLGGVGLGSG